MSSEWSKQPLTRAVARSIRSGTRTTRPYLDGHRFFFDDLKEIWSTPDRHQVVLTHKKDPVWQYWRFTDSDGWQFLGHFITKELAQAAAEFKHTEVAPSTPDAGTYVVATKEDRTLKVRCQSSDGPSALQGIFMRMGYSVEVQEVS